MSSKNTKTWDIAQFILSEASPNAHTEINSPPHAIPNIPTPAQGGYRHAQTFLTAHSSVLKIGDFLTKNKAKNASLKICHLDMQSLLLSKITAKL